MAGASAAARKTCDETADLAVQRLPIGEVRLPEAVGEEEVAFEADVALAHGRQGRVRRREAPRGESRLVARIKGNIVRAARLASCKRKQRQALRAGQGPGVRQATINLLQPLAGSNRRAIVLDRNKNYRRAIARVRVSARAALVVSQHFGPDHRKTDPLEATV